MTFAPGQQIDKYVLERRLGVTHMAEVWQGRHAWLGSPVAIKRMAPAYVSDPEFRTRFIQEAQRQAALKHPHIVNATDFVVIESECLLVMDFVEGGTVQDRIDSLRGPMSIEEVQRLASDALQGLGYAHQRGVIHRDIKPSNILIDALGRAHLADFGIALMAGEQRMTQTGIAPGTVEYMSPEQILRPREVDYRTDLYSFGCVLYEMLTGRPPFPGSGQSDFLIKDAHLRQEPPPIRGFNPAAPEWVEAAVRKAMAKRAEDRFASCWELEYALLQAPPVVVNATPAPVAPVQPEYANSGFVAPQPTPTPPPAPGPSKGPLLAVLAIVLVALGVAVWWFFFRPQPQPTPEPAPEPRPPIVEPAPPRPSPTPAPQENTVVPPSPGKNAERKASAAQKKGGTVKGAAADDTPKPAEKPAEPDPIEIMKGTAKKP